jgi:hypothetical protein
MTSAQPATNTIIRWLTHGCQVRLHVRVDINILLLPILLPFYYYPSARISYTDSNGLLMLTQIEPKHALRSFNLQIGLRAALLSP